MHCETFTNKATLAAAYVGLRLKVTCFCCRSRCGVVWNLHECEFSSSNHNPDDVTVTWYNLQCVFCFRKSVLKKTTASRVPRPPTSTGRTTTTTGAELDDYIMTFVVEFAHSFHLLSSRLCKSLHPQLSECLLLL